MYIASLLRHPPCDAGGADQAIAPVDTRSIMRVYTKFSCLMTTRAFARSIRAAERADYRMLMKDGRRGQASECGSGFGLTLCFGTEDDVVSRPRVALDRLAVGKCIVFPVDKMGGLSSPHPGHLLLLIFPYTIARTGHCGRVKCNLRPINIDRLRADHLLYP